MTLFTHLDVLGADVDAGHKVTHVVDGPRTDLFDACVTLPDRFEIQRVGRLAVGGAGRWRGDHLIPARSWRQLYPLAADRGGGAQIEREGGSGMRRLRCPRR